MFTFDIKAPRCVDWAAVFREKRNERNKIKHGNGDFCTKFLTLI